MDAYPVVDRIQVDQFVPGRTSRCWLKLATTSIGQPVLVPIMVARGALDGPVLGLTAALHGNELNGIPVIQWLFQELDATTLHGTVIGSPVLNVPGFLQQQRIFPDDTDLNRIMPGKKGGNDSQVYSYRLLDRLCSVFTHHFDYHTASLGRVNSHYVRADLARDDVKAMAFAQNATIILHGSGEPGNLRGAMAEHGIPSVTVELCDPQVYQPEVIDRAMVGLRNVLDLLGMAPGQRIEPARPATVCDRSYWIYTDQGGLLEVLPPVGETIDAGRTIAFLYNVFGDRIVEFTAAEAGIVIGKSVNPVNQTGGRVLHLGIPAQTF